MSTKEIVMWVLLAVGMTGLLGVIITASIDRLNWWVTRSELRFAIAILIGFGSVICLIVSAYLNNELLHQMAQQLHP